MSAWILCKAYDDKHWGKLRFFRERLVFSKWMAKAVERNRWHGAPKINAVHKQTE